MSSSSNSELPYIPVMEMPLLARKNILVQADNESFAKWCSYPQFAPLCGTNYNAQQVYKERCERLYDSELLKFKDETVTWKQFYQLLERLIPDLQHGMLDSTTAEDELYYYIEYPDAAIFCKLFKKLRPTLFNQYKNTLLEDAVLLGKWDLFKWLINEGANVQAIPVYNGMYINAPFEIIDIFIQNQRIPNKIHFDILIQQDRLDVLKLIYEKYNLLPPSLSYLQALNAYNLEIIKFMYENNVPLPIGVIRVAIENGDLDIVKYLVENGILPTREEINIYASTLVQNWLLADESRYTY